MLGPGYELLTLLDIGPNIDIPELGATYEENARAKAMAGARLGNLVTLGDDSGLEVDALGGKPGTLSARFAGENATDAQRVAYLLSLLKDIPREKRTARFICVIAIATPSGRVELCRAACEGYITFEPRGDNGFGYDPVFFFPELGKTMAELSMDVKNTVSHRSRAAQKARVILEELVRSGAIS